MKDKWHRGTLVNVKCYPYRVVMHLDVVKNTNCVQ